MTHYSCILGLVFRGHHRRTRILFGLADIILTALAFELAYRTRVRLGLAHTFFLTSQERALLLGWSMLVWVALGYWWGLYDRIYTAHPRVILRDVFRQCLLGATSLILFEYLQRMDLSRAFVALFAAFAWVLLCLFRLNAGRVLRVVRREFGSPHYVVVAGLGDGAMRLGRELEDAVPYGIRLTGFLADAGDPPRAEVQLDGKYPVWPLSQLAEILRRQVIDEIIFAIDSRRLPELEEVFLLCDEEGVRTRVAVDFFPHVNSEVYLDRLGALPLLTFSATPHDEIRLL